jgi:DNA-binding CsgD family transcriptional regulator
MPQPLTEVEVATLQAVADAGAMDEAGVLLGKRGDTVRQRMRLVRLKLDVQTSLAAVVWGFRHGVIR